MNGKHWCVAIIGDLASDQGRLQKAVEAMQSEERAGNEIVEVTSLDRSTSVTDLGTMKKRSIARWYDLLHSEFLATIDAVIIADVDWVDPYAPITKLDPEGVYHVLRDDFGYKGPIFPATTDWVTNDRLQAQGSQPTLHWESFHGQVVREIQKRRS